LLVAAGDLSQEEIAVAMKIPAATFRGRVHEARRRLKEKMKL
jgi:DNA-directed RNA polymerase specialized sigma24 family protein